MGRPGGAHWTPTPAAKENEAAALPPMGELFAPWDGSAAPIQRLLNVLHLFAHLLDEHFEFE